jgi:hypothetical protein
MCVEHSSNHRYQKDIDVFSFLSSHKAGIVTSEKFSSHLNCLSRHRIGVHGAQQRWDRFVQYTRGSPISTDALVRAYLAQLKKVVV